MTQGTQKYADFLDACVAITGRAPRAGCHVDAERRPEVLLSVPELDAGRASYQGSSAFGIQALPSARARFGR